MKALLKDLIGRSTSKEAIKTAQVAPRHKVGDKPVEVRDFPPSIAQNISTCQFHDNQLFPHIKALEFCNTCEIGMCYMCATEHVNGNHNHDWGFDIFNAMEPPRNEVNEAFNSGYRSLFDWSKARCPCGNKLEGYKTATICSACGTATCSAECHDRYVQSQGRCLFKRNFLDIPETSHI